MTVADLSFLTEPGAVADWRMVLLFHVATETGLLDALPGRSEELAEHLGLDARGVRVLLTALGAWDVVEAGSDGTYSRGSGAPSDEEGPVLYQHARTIRHWASGLEDRVRGIPAEEPAGRISRPDRWQAAMAVHAHDLAPRVVDAVLAAAPDAASVGPGGDTHAEAEYPEWMAEARFAPPRIVDLDGGRRSLLLARAPD